MAKDDEPMIPYECLDWLMCQPPGYMEVVQSRDQATLHDIIQQRTLVVHTDE